LWPAGGRGFISQFCRLKIANSLKIHYTGPAGPGFLLKIVNFLKARSPVYLWQRILKYNTMSKYDLIVIGSGPGGLRCGYPGLSAGPQSGRGGEGGNWAAYALTGGGIPTKHC